MANKKFSQFDLKTNSTDVQFVVGYNGTDNVRIAPSNLSSGGASDLNGLSDVSIDLTNDNAFFINIPSGISGATGCLFIGENAGNSVVGSPKNIAIGFDSFKTTSDNARDNNVVIGYEACQLSTLQVQYNVFIGNQAGKNLSNTYSNVAIGYQAMSTGSGFDSVAVGYRAGANATGSAITAVGWQAGDGATGGNLTALGGSFYVGGAGADVSGISCTAIGGGALQNATVEGCTAVGYTAGRAHTSGVGSTYIGFESGLTNTTSGYRTMLGWRSGRSHTGQFSTGIGYQAMSMGTGMLNVAVGSNAMMANDGARSTAIGHQAMVNCSGADDCVAIGQSALSAASAGDRNVAIGVNAGQQTTGVDNVLVGYGAGDDTGAWNNTIIIGKDGATSPIGQSNFIVLGNSSHTTLQIPGIQSGASNGDVLTYNASLGKLELAAAGGGGASSLNGLSDCTTVGTGNAFIGNVPSNLNSANATENVVIGIDAGNAMANNDGSTIIGYQAGYINVYSYTTQIGTRAGRNVNSSHNTFIGYEAGQAFGVSSTDAKQNTLIGYRAGNMIRGLAYTGQYAFGCTYLGHQTGNGAGNLTGENQIVIGRNAAPSSGSVDNEITLGDSNITALRCAVTSITSLSDERDKSEIKDLEYGLAFIDALQPREFVWDNRAETRTEVDEDNNETEVEFYSANKGKKDFGFIAQEVQELDNDTLRLVYSENEDKLELSYGKIVPILVKAIQELKEEVELLKAK